MAIIFMYCRPSNIVDLLWVGEMKMEHIAFEYLGPSFILCIHLHHMDI